MNKRIVLSVILAPLIFSSLIFAVGCGESETEPKMTAPEVCQYVNQALRPEHELISLTARREVCFRALSAKHLGEGIWQVEVEKTVQYQQLKEGQWIPTQSLLGISTPEATYSAQYLFNETTALLTEK